MRVIAKVIKLVPVMMILTQSKDQDKLKKNIKCNAQSKRKTNKKKGTHISVVDKIIY
jgi:hypothetical protein